MENNISQISLKSILVDFPGGPVVKNQPANARDKGLIPAPGGVYMLQSN